MARAGGGPLTRWRGLVGVGVVRIGRRSARSRTALSVAGIAAAVAAMTLVTSVGLGIAAQSTVAGGSADYWILPESGASSVVAPAEGQRFGEVHAASTSIQRVDGVTYATPVLVSLVRLDTPSPGPTYAFAVGVVPARNQSVVGLSMAGLTPGDPAHAGGERTGEAVLSAGAAETLDASRGDRLTLASGRADANRTFAVAGTTRARAVGLGQLPVLVVHLAELQAITGASDVDAADMFLVDADGSRPLDADLAGVYPRSRVLSRSDLLRHQVETRPLPAALSLAAGLVAVVVGTLFVVTAVGMEITGTAAERAVLAAVGLSARSRALLVGTHVLAITAMGAVLGLVVWGVGLVATNAVLTGLLGEPALARYHPLIAAYGLLAAGLVGLLALPYLLVTGHRTATLERLAR